MPALDGCQWSLKLRLIEKSAVNRQRSESLVDYIKRTRNGGRLSLSDVERQSARSGYKISDQEEPLQNRER